MGMVDTAGDAGVGRRVTKSPAAFRTISEVANELEVPQHVLRFWESKFSQVRPLKRGGGRRYYRPEDVELLRRIRALLYDDGYTIKGVQKLLRENGRRPVRGPGRPSQVRGPGDDKRSGREGQIQRVIDDLTELRDLLQRQKR